MQRVNFVVYNSLVFALICGFRWPWPDSRQHLIFWMVMNRLFWAEKLCQPDSSDFSIDADI